MTAPAGYDPTVPPPAPGAYDLGDIVRLDVTFPSDGCTLAGHVYLPPEAPPSGRHPAVILDGPAPSVKELTVPAYAIHLARAGYLTLTFDRRGWGGSGGHVRQHLNPPDNIRDIRNATTYLLARDDVDGDRLTGIGVCTGGGFMLQAGALDRRYRATACIAAYFGARRQLRDTIGHQGWTAQIRAAAHERLADLRAGSPRIHQALAPSTAPEGAALTLMDEAHDFYTSRQRQIAPHWVNQMTVESVHNLLEFDAVTYASLVAPTPLLVIHGTIDPNTPPRYAQEVYDTAHEPKTLVWIETTNHIQLYDQPQVNQAATTLIDWLDVHANP